MENYRLRIKIGDHEFEAEGPKEIVKEQFDEFRQLIQEQDHPSRQLKSPVVRTKSRKERETAPEEERELTPTEALALARIGKVIGYDKKTRLISLTVLPQGERKHADAVLLLLLGYKQYREDDLVPVTSINKSLEQSGYGVDRLDRVMEGYLKDNLVLKVGTGKGGKYRFTNRGLQRAEEVVDELLKIVVGD